MLSFPSYSVRVIIPKKRPPMLLSVLQQEHRQSSQNTCASDSGHSKRLSSRGRGGGGVIVLVVVVVAGSGRLGVGDRAGLYGQYSPALWSLFQSILSIACLPLWSLVVQTFCLGWQMEQSALRTGDVPRTKARPWYSSAPLRPARIPAQAC